MMEAPRATFFYALEELFYLVDPRRADLVADRRVILYDVRGGSAGIDVSVVDPRFRDHVLSQVVAAHVHEFNGVQGTSSEVWGCACMGGNTLKNRSLRP